MEHYKSRNNDYYHFTNPHDDRSQFDDSDEFQYYYDVDNEDYSTCDFNFHNSSPSANSKASGVSVTVEEIGGFDEGNFIFQLENTMKNVTDKIRHEIDRIETRISRLEDETCKLDKYVADVKDSEERYHGMTHRKLNQMQTILQEVHDGVLFLRDKHEIAETQLQLAKLQVLKRGTKTAVRTNQPQSSHIPFTAPFNLLPLNGIISSQDISYRQAPEIIAQQRVIPLNQQTPHQYKVDPHFTQFTQIYQFNSSQERPNMPSNSYASSVQNVPSKPARWDSTQEHELTRSPRNFKSEFHAKYMPEFDNFPIVHPHRKPPTLYENSNFKPVEYSLHPQEENSKRKYTYIPVSQTLPHALPTAIDLEDGSRSEEIGNSIPVDDIVDKVTSMGFRRDLVKSCVRKLMVNGSVMDLNAVLDTMMNNNMN